MCAGLSQSRFARLLGVSVRTLQEQKASMHPGSTLTRPSTTRSFRVGEWTLDLARCSLAQRDGSPLAYLHQREHAAAPAQLAGPGL